MNEPQPADVRAAWDRIRPGLEYIKKNLRPRWRPEDIYHACRAGEAHLYVGPEGFLVLREQVCPYTLEKELLVWVACGEGGGLAGKYMGWLEDLARRIGATSLVCQSPRKGLERLTGWTEEHKVYRRLV